MISDTSKENETNGNQLGNETGKNPQTNSKTSPVSTHHAVQNQTVWRRRYNFITDR